MNGDVGGWSVFYAFDGHFFDNITTQAQRFHMVLFALTIAVLTSKTNLLVRHVTPSKKHWLICLLQSVCAGALRVMNLLDLCSGLFCP